MDILEILSNVRSSGSGTGNSHYMEQCAARHILDEAHPQEGGFDAQVGTLVHKLLELHYTRQLTDVALPLDDFANFEADPIQESLRIFSAYSKYFPADEFDVLACELQIPEVDAAGQLTAQGVLQAAWLAENIVDPYTIRPDMVVRFNEEQAANWLVRRKQPIAPGVYLIDHKTHKKAESSAVQAHAMGPQVPLYTRCYNGLAAAGLMCINGEALPECQGLIINSMVRHSDMTPEATHRRAASFQCYLMDVGSDLSLATYREHYRRQKAYLATGAPNPSQCRSFGRVCAHYETGRCDRVTLVKLGAS